VKAVLADPCQVKQITHQVYPLGGVSITILVMAFSQMSPEDQHAVKAAQQTLRNMDRVYSSSAHGQHGPDSAGILKPRDASQVGGGIGTPVAQKSQDFGGEHFVHAHLPSAAK
jgi:hypothetical protein